MSDFVDSDSVLLGTNHRIPSSSSSSPVRAAAADTTSVHLLPCSIEYDGPARVSDYFRPRQVSAKGDIEATLRGRLLRGQTVKLPDDISGFVLQQTDLKIGGASGEARNYAIVHGVFDEITYWNHDLAPSGRDYLPQAMRWFDVARAVHAPLPILEQEDEGTTGDTTAKTAPVPAVP